MKISKGCTVAGAMMMCAGTAFAQSGVVDFDGTETGLTGYTNDQIVGDGTTNGNLISGEFFANYSASGDAFNPMSRSSLMPTETDAGQVGMPFNIADSSVAGPAGSGPFAGDTLGFAGVAKQDGFFGVTDTVNFNNTFAVATFTFDVSGETDLGFAVDVAAMGDFEDPEDVFLFEYSLDGSPFQPLFSAIAWESGSTVYTMDGGAVVNLDDPLIMNGVLLNDVFQTIKTPISGTGNSLTIRFTARTDGGEGFGFDNLTVPTPGSLALLGLGGLAATRRRRA